MSTPATTPPCSPSCAATSLTSTASPATGRGDRTRRFTDDAERARTAVRKAIKRALHEIDAADPAIGSLLHTTITTGSTCTYTPDPTRAIDWSVGGRGAPDIGPH
jgi:hypothetical protein